VVQELVRPGVAAALKAQISKSQGPAKCFIAAALFV
jgi:hypothetical protein